MKNVFSYWSTLLTCTYLAYRFALFTVPHRSKLEAKYDPVVARQCLLWMETLFNEAGEEVEFDTSGDPETFQKDLKDGIILCR